MSKITIELTQREIDYLSDLRKIAIWDDVFDLQAYDSISRANEISNCWEALKVIERLTNNK